MVAELLVEEGETVDVGTPIIADRHRPEHAAARRRGRGRHDRRRRGHRARPEAAPAGGQEGSDAKREPVLVGYGVKQTERRRRAPRRGPAPPGRRRRRPQGAESADRSASRPGPGATEPGGPHADAPAAPHRRSGRRRSRWPSRRSASSPRTSASTCAGSSATGADGIVTREDVHAAASGTPTRRHRVRRPAAAPAAVPAPTARRRVPIKGVRKTTAQAMVRRAFTAPHVTEFLTRRRHPRR